MTDTGAVERHYESFAEGPRLQRSRVRRLEFATTLRVVSRHLPSAARVLELGAGHGAYSLRLAREGHRVAATDLAASNVAVIASLARGEGLDLVTRQIDATDLAPFEDASFDAVLCLGPFYHLRTAALRRRALLECRRVVRPTGFLALSYINVAFGLAHLVRSGLPLTPEQYMALGTADDQRTDYPDDFFNITHLTEPQTAVAEVQRAGFTVVEHAGTDGVFGFFADLLESLGEPAFRAYAAHHLQSCSTPAAPGASGHNLLIARPG